MPPNTWPSPVGTLPVWLMKGKSKRFELDKDDWFRIARCTASLPKAVHKQLPVVIFSEAIARLYAQGDLLILTNAVVSDRRFSTAFGFLRTKRNRAWLT